MVAIVTYVMLNKSQQRVTLTAPSTKVITLIANIDTGALFKQLARLRELISLMLTLAVLCEQVAS